MAATKCVPQQQEQSGLGLEAQRAAVQGYIDAEDRKLVAEVVEIETGKRSDRPELAKALALCRVHHATLLVAKLDRLARNVAFVSNLMESQVDFVAVDFPLANRFMIQHPCQRCRVRGSDDLGLCTLFMNPARALRCSSNINYASSIAAASVLPSCAPQSDSATTERSPPGCASRTTVTIK